jgi:hypothetical protein
VPILYPQVAGAAEVLDSGIKIDPNDLNATAAALAGILSDPKTNGRRWRCGRPRK